MAHEWKVCGDLPMEVNGDYSSYQYRLCFVNEVGRAELGSAGTPNCMILQDKPNAAGRAGQFRVAGISKIQVGTAFDTGDQIIADKNGKGAPRGATTGVWVIGFATDEGRADEVASVLICPFHI